MHRDTLLMLSLTSGLILSAPISIALADCGATDQRYVIHDNSTVTDLETGLMWKQCVQGGSSSDCLAGEGRLFIRADAMNSARAEEFGGHSDWRLPKIEELQSLVTTCDGGSTINHQAFPNSDEVSVHSVSGGLDYGTKNWIVDFGTGESLVADDNTERQVRVVRTVK